MKPEEQKARDLYLQMYRKLPFDVDVKTENAHGKWGYDSTELAKEHATIAVEYAIEEIQQYGFDDRIPFLEKVKEAITKLK